MVISSPCLTGIRTDEVIANGLWDKDFSNPFRVDIYSKIVRFSVLNSPCFCGEELATLASPKANELTIPEQTATGKGTSNPLMAGSLPKTTKPT
ncbi:hypothetical protein Tco_0366279 [Tanacetum coccineum]